MKHKSLSKKLFLSKETISNLFEEEMAHVNGAAGYPTDIQHCWTMYKDQCNSNDPRYCYPTIVHQC
jgi:hypothetical protein